jgi:hypothetical protein
VLCNFATRICSSGIVAQLFLALHLQSTVHNHILYKYSFVRLELLSFIMRLFDLLLEILHIILYLAFCLRGVKRGIRLRLVNIKCPLLSMLPEG